MAWLILAIMGAVTYLYGVSTHAMVLCLLTKPVPVLALLGWLHSGPVSPYRHWISIGLGFSLLGDILLAWPQDLFVFGLGAFLFAHLAYLKAYLADCRRAAVRALILALLAGGSLLSVMASQGLGDLLVPVGVYALAIS
ncbi:MAG: lysoplasmalogenase, partial [Pseudomonas sp.]|nr:lysoplasmalogenase [Pseudomonas sp.]